MKSIPTADEFIANHIELEYDQVKKIMIEFAKLHVKAALKAASESADVTGETIVSFQEGSTLEIDKDTILNAYPETLIK